MSGNTFGKLFTLTSFGESHGPAIGGIVDGCPPGMDLNELDMQTDLDRRKPGTSKFVKVKQLGHQLVLSYEIKIKEVKTTLKLRTHLDQVTLTLPTPKNME